MPPRGYGINVAMYASIAVDVVRVAPLATAPWQEEIPGPLAPSLQLKLASTL